MMSGLAQNGRITTNRPSTADALGSSTTVPSSSNVLHGIGRRPTGSSAGVHHEQEHWRPRQLARLQLLGNSVVASRLKSPPSTPAGSSRNGLDVDHLGVLRQRTAAVVLDPAVLATTGQTRIVRRVGLHQDASMPVRKTVKTAIPAGASRSSGARSTPSSAEEVEATERVKMKLLSVWNNVKFGWTVRLKTNFSRDTPIWFLGQCYHHKLKDDDAGVSEPCGLAYGMEGFKQDFISRIWLTYRREFPTLAGSAYSTDCGWGCMLRSGQMMLAQALVCHFLGRGWRWQSSSHQEEKIHRRIARWFGDFPARSSPFSIHRLVNLGEVSGKRAGDWYGPASVAHIIRQSLEQSGYADPILGEVCVYVAQDCTVYKQDVLKLCRGGGGFAAQGMSPQLLFSLRPRWRAVIILVPVRLGGERLNPIYFKCVQAILSNDYCIGIIGGRPRHSLYFVGWQEDKLIHLDPHYCQEAVDVTTSDFPLQSFHCMSPRKLSFTRMDPSCTIGFYCRTEDDVMKFLTSCNEVLTPPRPQADYPVFVVAECSSSEVNDVAPYRSSLVRSFGYEQSFSSCYSASEEPTGDMASDDEDYEEFVFL